MHKETYSSEQQQHCQKQRCDHNQQKQWRDRHYTQKQQSHCQYQKQEHQQDRQKQSRQNFSLASMNLTIDERKESEGKVVAKMIQIYCRAHHASENRDSIVAGSKKRRSNYRCEYLCDECADLLEYAQKRITECPYSKNKPFCSRCKIHCYNDGMRRRIRAVMRYSGPRMLLYSPRLVVKHFLDGMKK